MAIPIYTDVSKPKFVMHGSGSIISMSDVKPAYETHDCRLLPENVLS